ncbi:glycosyltransferase family 2 protein [Flavobacterium sp. NKUCC04_CG]|uniref:glycosyltransferase family 2 protein n=1 Tax=Flavobacterium sp. NKUCC04_CG TaxID=2842121 RepID=UPI001C5A7B11|nr:glycosyltransferase family 2 protein [Flavobacterium sp. NKUCC04_CG]MBW3520250.1 glycosyltransferase family 2 protein [Flavobacterium sp. NKUCC04_CG]
MQLSVIILNYNVAYFLELCIRSVQKALIDMDAEIIVVDNNSSDNSSLMMQQHFPDLHYIANSENYGFPKGNNMGVAVAQGEYLCILNPDTVVAEDTFTSLYNFAQQQTDSGIIGCRLIDGAGAFLPESKRGVPTPWVAFTKVSGLGQCFSRSSWFNRYYAQHLNENQTGPTDILVGAFMWLKRDLYLEVGGFDEDCFMYSDDIDLSYLVLKTGKVNFYFAQTTVIHYKGESTLKDETFRNRFRDAMQFFYKKHFKKSLFFDGMMTLGTLYFSFVKQRETGGKSMDPQVYFLVSENRELQASVQAKINKEIHLFSSLAALKKELKRQNDIYTEIVFDGDFVSNKELICFMKEESSRFITFKIKPSQSDFLIGSNNRNDRGQIIPL